MDFRNALNKTPGNFIEKEVILKKEEIVNTLSDEENYMLNREDSVLINVIDDINKLCDNFIEESLILEKPLIMKHHSGFSDFKVELLKIFQENVVVEISEFEEETDEESDLDSLDMLYENDYS